MKEPYKKVIEFYKNSSPKQHQYFLNLISDQMTFFNQETSEQFDIDDECQVDFNGIFHQINLKGSYDSTFAKDPSIEALIDSERKSIGYAESDANSDEDILARLISKYCEWDGAFIYRLARECFTECNHHTFNKAFKKLWEKEILKTDHINKKDKDESNNK